MTDRLAAARKLLDQHGQGHVLHFVDQLDDPQRLQLIDQIEGIDWPEVARLIDSHVLNKPEFKLPEQLEPAPCYGMTPAADQQQKYTDARALGEQLIRDGKVAAFTVAGGQGTRLGYDGPKGSFPATPIRKLPLFGIFAEFIIKTQQKYGSIVPWYVMTSPVNDQPTREAFEQNDYFGLDPANVSFFPQAMMPAINKTTGKVLLESPDSLALSPNGHGGSLKALYTSGAIDDMKSRGIEQISYTQVDNPVVKVIDPLFIGLHALDSAQMSSKMVAKAEPLERVGNFCLADGRVAVIEYSDLPDELALQRNDDGSIRFNAGSIAIHVIRTDFVESVNTADGGFGLPFHRAEKKVPYVDLDSGQQVSPESPNAVKLETFVFDALPMCEKSIVFETDRVEEFAPIKNASGDGIVDSPATSADLQVERHARWLEANGVTVPRDGDGQVNAVIEIKGTTAVEPTDLANVDLPGSVEPGSELLL